MRARLVAPGTRKPSQIDDRGLALSLGTFQLCGMSIQEIEQAIPHRAPMLLLDEIISRDESTIVCRKTFLADEYFVQGHFPGQPLVNGSRVHLRDRHEILKKGCSLWKSFHSNRKNEENRLKIDKILLFLPFAQKIMFTFVIFSPHNQDSFHASSAQIHFSTPTAYSSVRRRTLIDLLGQLYFGVCLTALG